MKKTLTEIAEIVEGKVVGDGKIIISGLSGIEEAKEGDLSFVANSKYISLTQKTKASALITSHDLTVPGKAVIQTDNPSLAFAKIASYLSDDDSGRSPGIHPKAVIDKKAKIGKNVIIGPCVVIESEAQIGDDTVILAGTFVGHHAKVGKTCLLHPNVTICEYSHVGNKVIIHSGTVVGSDGFGYELEKGKHVKIPQIGKVVIEDDVEIGANVTIDRARFDKTVIGRGSKIDNLVQVAHNVVMGENCIVVSQAGISGSTKIERDVTLAGQVGVAGHLTIGEGSIIAARAGVIKSVPPNSKVSGFPAKPHDQAKRVNASLQRLPIYVKLLKKLEIQIEEIKSKLKI